MADRRGVALVLLILLSASAVGALAGYRMHLQDDWHATAEPVDALVFIAFPDDTWSNATVTVQGGHANALGALEAAAAEAGLSVGVRSYSFGAFVYEIGDFRAEPYASCGWLYSIGGEGEAYQPDQSAERQHLSDGDEVYWYWGCI